MNEKHISDETVTFGRLKIKKRPKKETEGLVKNMDLLDVGGREGGKQFVDVFLGKENSERFAGTFVSKEYARNQEDIVDRVIRAYTLLREHGVPVPNTTRKYIDNNGNTLKLLMTDMTQGGKYLVWGSSDSMSSAQHETYDSIKLTKVDIETIQKKVDKITSRATQAGCVLKYYYYHLLFNPETQEADVCLLDVDPVSQVVEQQDKLLEKNKSAGRLFMSNVYMLASDDMYTDEDDF